MTKRHLAITAAFAAIAIALTGCSKSEEAGSTRACIILPDAESSPRWETGDRPALDSALQVQVSRQIFKMHKVIQLSTQQLLNK
jgi:hypothetical protein